MPSREELRFLLESHAVLLACCFRALAVNHTVSLLLLLKHDAINKKPLVRVLQPCARAASLLAGEAA